MASAPGKSEAPTEHDSGVGRIRERTIVIGDTLIAIDNIGSIQILEVSRNWSLARLGVFIALGGGGAMMFLNNPYSYGGSGSSPNQIFGMILIGLGLFMIVVNALQPLRKGLGIGTGDGRITYIVSGDHAFLHRLLEFLTLKINTRNEGLTASFDITHNTFNTAGGGVAIGASAVASGADSTIANTEGGGLVIGAGGIASGSGGHALGDNGSVSSTNNNPPQPTAAPPQPAPVAEAPIDPDDSLFADDPPPAPAPPPRVDPPRPLRTAAAARTQPHDPLLDGPATRSAESAGDRDWLSAPGRVGYRPEPEGGARWLLPLVLLLLVGGGAFAGWYFYSQSQTSTLVSLIPAPPEPTLQQAPLNVAAEPAAATPVEAVPVMPTEPAAGPIPAPAEAPATPPAAAPQAILAPAAPALETIDFTPPEMLVARASGLRYRARPSTADDVAVIAETRAGGEALLVNGRSVQADGEWYRVALPDGRPAWFKASLAVPRSRFAETFATGASPQALTFAAAAPRILEPAEGMQLSGGAQPVRLAWQGPADASTYVVEIEAYDAVAHRWIEDPLHKRVTVESMEEIAETIPGTGAWRWRVRAISPAGEQSQFSRWSAFSVRD